MYIVDGIAYAGEASKELAVKDIKILDKMYMLVEFNTGEQRILDATVLLKYPVYQKLQSKEAFMSASVEDGVLVWLDGDIDIGTTTLYNMTLPYESEQLA